MKSLILLLTFLSTTVMAGEIVLMTSLELKPGHIRKLEQKFTKQFQHSGHELVIHHDADPATLYKVMTSDETVGVFWVSHAAKEKQTKHAGMVANAVILDKAGNDVKNFFTLVPANLRFLAIVGCEALPIINGFRARGNYNTTSDLEIMSFEKKVIMQKGFAKALKRGAEIFTTQAAIKNDSQQPEVSLSLSRQFSGTDTLASTWVEVGDRVIAFFAQNETSIKEASVPLSHWNQLTNKNIKHKLVVNEEDAAHEMGRLQFAVDRSVGGWKLFELNGKSLSGKDQQLYVYRP